jgi:hypothetical protein
MHAPSINFLAVIVAAIVIWVLGALWYSKAMFATKWMALQGRTEEQMRADAAGANMGLLLVQAFICSLLIALVLSMVLTHFHGDTGGFGGVHGAMAGFLAWLGFAGATSYATNLFSSRPRQLWLIDSGYNLVSFVLAGVILAVWR